MRITVVGLGYVGLANAVLLARKHEVVSLDIDAPRVELVNKRVSPLVDQELIQHFSEVELNLTATTDAAVALEDPEFVIIATPTNYDPDTQYFDTSSVETVLQQVADNAPNAVAVIKSTIPIGFTQRMQEKYSNLQIVFSPEFLREGKALYDNLHPSRVIASGAEEPATRFAEMMVDAAEDTDVPTVITGTDEAEAIKLFSNTYLAMRVAYFNELDTFAVEKGLDAGAVIRGVSLDPRIGDHYNNPSFGYGGYCLPKDTRQLRANYEGVPQNLIDAIVDSNQTRMAFIIDDVLRQKPSVVGIHRLAMKAGSDNFRSSSISVVLEGLRDRGTEVIIYEPTVEQSPIEGVALENDLNTFLERSDLIITNRVSDELESVREKIYSRDVYGRD